MDKNNKFYKIMIERLKKKNLHIQMRQTTTINYKNMLCIHP